MIIESDKIIITQEPVNNSNVKVEASALTGDEFKSLFYACVNFKEIIFYIKDRSVLLNDKNN